MARQKTKKYYAEMKELAKRTNRRMRALEKAGMTGSPAYQGIQARLHALGIKPAKEGSGARFSESGKATEAEHRTLLKILKKYDESVTATVRGTRDFYNRGWKTANEKYHLTEHGITKEDWFTIWSSMKGKKRTFASSSYVQMVEVAKRKQSKKDEKKTVGEMLKAIAQTKNKKDAYRAVGLSYNDMKTSKIKIPPKQSKRMK